ncbi:MAG: Rieske (2Fe-2S) protein [Proteobacteria bacterium]|nr:Rieske (2Fe-2S) protein [Pseudomonadota bacterium]
MNHKKPCDGCLSRRQALSNGAQLGLGVAAVAVISACGHESKKNGDPGTTVPTASGVATLDFATYPNLQTTGGSYRLNINGNPVSVTRMSDTSVVAVVALCTHEGATLGGVSGASMTCPRHGATFSANGTATGGPNGGNLSQYPATLRTTGVTIKVA